jgi:hypothetical protein
MQEDDEEINLRLEREIQRDSMREIRSGNTIEHSTDNQYATIMTGASAFEDENLLEE